MLIKISKNKFQDFYLLIPIVKTKEFRTYLVDYPEVIYRGLKEGLKDNIINDFEK